MTSENRMTVRMFGRFEVAYNNQILNLGHSQTTKAMKLLQMLLFYGEEGIHRAQVIQSAGSGPQSAQDFRTVRTPGT